MQRTSEVAADWHFTAAALRLARELWYQRIEAFELDTERTWEVQPSDVKNSYIVRAAQVLDAVRPAKTKSYLALALSLDLRTQAHAKVIGEINSQFPWGVSK